MASSQELPGSVSWPPRSSAWRAEPAPPTTRRRVAQREFEWSSSVQTNWPQPIPGHEDWVWGASTGVFAESPDRVFVVQRGQLPLPEGMEPGWDAIASTPGNRAIGGNRFEHSIYIVDASGRIIDSWPQWDYLFPGGRGPHQVAINPYDPEKHVWVVDDQLHQIFKFTKHLTHNTETVTRVLAPKLLETC